MKDFWTLSYLFPSSKASLSSSSLVLTSTSSVKGIYEEWNIIISKFRGNFYNLIYVCLIYITVICILCMLCIFDIVKV